ncbi:MFS domain-containing protein [Favolaschia claudopus]|uniref:MFS domain-containing protein n=1 Tax=Favolaschia claudopus TaxID=2862362 RepID=A0AAW0CIZ1_9AGAR
MSAVDEKTSPSASSSHEDVIEVLGTQTGVRRIEAIQSVWGTKSKIVLWISVALASYMYILDNGTNWAWGSYASIQFGHYQQFAAIQCATSILLAIGKPMFAKFTDAVGRAEIALFCYVLGYIVNATTPNMAGLGGGSCIWVLGFSGLQIALQIVIADVTTLRWRPIISTLSTGGWYFINFYANGQITAQLTKVGGLGWRWGYGIYAITYIPALSPIIIVLLWAQRRAKAQGILKDAEPSTGTRPSLGQRFRAFAVDVDAVGLFLLAGNALIRQTKSSLLVPIVLAGGPYSTTTWHNPAIPAMIVIGGALVFPLFVYWETKRATYPVIPWRLLRNRTVLAGCAINFFDFVSFYLTYSELYGFVSATTNWKIDNLVYYSNAQSLSLTFFGVSWAVVAGILTSGYKKALIAALAIRDSRTVMTQIIQGMGGGIAAVASQIGAQGAVPHQDVALATAALLLSAEVGGVVGTAAAGALWANRLPEQIAKHLPSLNSTEIGSYVGSPTLVRLLTGEEHTAMVSAYSSTMHILLIPGIIFSVIPFLAAFFVKDFQLAEIQNAVEVKTLDGKRAHNAGESIEPKMLEAAKV